MSTINPVIGRVLAGIGGVLLLGSLFIDWVDLAGATQDGWQSLDTWDVFLALTGVCGITAALTGGQFGFFRPDLSFNAMTDIFGVMATTLIAWFLVADFPAGASKEVGGYVALAGALLLATGAGDFRVNSVFPRLPGSGRP